MCHIFAIWLGFSGHSLLSFSNDYYAIRQATSFAKYVYNETT